MSVEYRVVELMIVTDESLTVVLNEYAASGWHLDTIHFAMRDSSKRPAMAFVIFNRDSRSGEATAQPPEPFPPLLDDEEPGTIVAVDRQYEADFDTDESAD